MSQRDYRFFVEPLTDTANESIAEWHNARGKSAASLEIQTIEVDGRKIEGVYLVDHSFVTKLGHSGLRKDVRVYVQEGNGEIRRYIHFQTVARRLARTKAVMSIKKKLVELAK